MSFERILESFNILNDSSQKRLREKQKPKSAKSLLKDPHNSEEFNHYLREKLEVREREKKMR